jgi:hypothetical protein
VTSAPAELSATPNCDGTQHQRRHEVGPLQRVAHVLQSAGFGAGWGRTGHAAGFGVHRCSKKNAKSLP